MQASQTRRGRKGAGRGAGSEMPATEREHRRKRDHHLPLNDRMGVEDKTPPPKTRPLAKAGGARQGTPSLFVPVVELSIHLVGRGKEPDERTKKPD